MLKSHIQEIGSGGLNCLLIRPGIPPVSILLSGFPSGAEGYMPSSGSWRHWVG